MPNQINGALCYELADLIVENPERHDQHSWARSPIEPRSYDDADVALAVADVRPYVHEPFPTVPANPEMPLCQTQGCVAGLAYILTAPEGSKLVLHYGMPFGLIPDGEAYEYVGISIFAREAIGCDHVQAEWLFNYDRTRAQVVWALNYLPEHPDAYLTDAWLARATVRLSGR